MIPTSSRGVTAQPFLCLLVEECPVTSATVFHSRGYGCFNNARVTSPVGLNQRGTFQRDVRYSQGQITALWASPPSLPLEDALGGEDILIGTFLAFGLAILVSFLQGQRSQNDFVLWEKTAESSRQGFFSTENDTNATYVEDLLLAQDTNNVFDAASWEEMSQPDNYIFYRNKIRKNNDLAANRSLSDKVSRAVVEKPWVLIAMIALFLPIFSVEFFFTLSRQVICGGNPLTQTDWAQQLCSPAVIN